MSTPAPAIPATCAAVEPRTRSPFRPIHHVTTGASHMTPIRTGYLRTTHNLGALWAATALRARRARTDRGDVPGWVLITVMTAGLVSALWLIAGPALVEMFQTSLSSVTGKK